MFNVLVLDGEVGSEHGCSDFAAVVAVADESVDESWSLDWLRHQTLLTWTLTHEKEHEHRAPAKGD